jgi:hypothetical protein
VGDGRINIVAIVFEQACNRDGNTVRTGTRVGTSRVNTGARKKVIVFEQTP